MKFFTILRKELTQQWRTKHFLIVVAILVVFGLASPLLAKLTPELLKSIPDMPAGMADLVPEPTLTDAVMQYVKNISQFGILLALLMSMGSVAQEKERGTASLMLTHPVSRLSFLLAKFVALSATFFASLTLSALGFWYYTMLLFGELPWGSFLVLNSLMLVVLLVYVAATLLGSTLARSQGAAAGLAFVALVVLAGIGSLPRISEYMPGRLFNWGASATLGGAETAWPAFWISLGLIALFLGISWLVFRRQEL